MIELQRSSSFKSDWWSLRQYSKTNPQWVEELMKELVLSPLAQREGSKYLAKASE